MPPKRKSRTLAALTSLHILFWLVVLERFIDTSFLHPKVGVAMEVASLLLR